MAESAGSATRRNEIRPMGPCISAPWGKKELTCWRSAALHRLPGPDRTLIRQLYWDGLPRTGIARQEGVSEGAIRKREQRILKSLHSDLQEALSIPVQLPKRKCK